MDQMTMILLITIGGPCAFTCILTCIYCCYFYRYGDAYHNKNERREDHLETEDQLRQRLEIGLQLAKLQSTPAQDKTEAEPSHLETEEIEAEKSMAQQKKKRQQFWKNKQETLSHDQKSEEGMEIEEDDKSYKMHTVLRNV